MGEERETKQSLAAALYSDSHVVDLVVDDEPDSGALVGVGVLRDLLEGVDLRGSGCELTACHTACICCSTFVILAVRCTDEERESSTASPRLERVSTATRLSRSETLAGRHERRDALAAMQ